MDAPMQAQDTAGVVMDYPTAWAFIREQHPDPKEHDPKCSWAQTNGAMLCDCDVIWDEYVRRGGSDPRIPARPEPPDQRSDSPSPLV